MINVKFNFQDFSEEKQTEIWNAVRDEIQTEIAEAITENHAEADDNKKDDLANEIIDNYINTHNFTKSYEI